MAERTKETDSKKKSSRKTSIDGKILPNNYEAEQAVQIKLMNLNQNME